MSGEFAPITLSQARRLIWIELFFFVFCAAFWLAGIMTKWNTSIPVVAIILLLVMVLATEWVARKVSGLKKSERDRLQWQFPFWPYIASFFAVWAVYWAVDRGKFHINLGRNWFIFFTFVAGSFLRVAISLVRLPIILDRFNQNASR